MITTNGDLLLEAIKTQGVEYIFCSPGTEWSPVWEGLVKRHTHGDNSLKYINCRHESLAVTAALGYSRATGRTPAVLLHTNVGALNGAMAIRTAYWAQVPMLICDGDSSTFGAQNENGAQWLNRLSDIGRPNNLVKQYVKWSNEVLAVETMVDSVYRGCQIANSVPQGPSFISIPHELMLENTSVKTIPMRYKVPGLPDPNPDEVKEVADLLLKSKLPIIITENIGKTPKAISRLVELTELLGMPVFESVDPLFHNFPKDHPLHSGIDANAGLNETDMIFVVGCQTPWHPPARFPKNGAKVILLDEHPIKERLPYWGYQMDMVIKADIEKWLSSLLEHLYLKENELKIDQDLVKNRFNLWGQKHIQLRDRLEKEALAGKSNMPISAKYFFHLTNNLLPKDCIVMSEATTHENLIRNYITSPTKYFKCQYGGLGVGLGTSAGFKLANPNSPVVLFVGDGALNYNPVVAGLGLCHEYDLPIMVVVLNNGGYMAMKYAHQRIYPEGDSVKSNTFLGTSISSGVDYCKIAQGFDAYTEKVTQPDQIEGAMTRALEQLGKNRLTLLNVLMD